MGITEKFNHLKRIISDPNFLSGKVLCNDLPIFIADYDITEEDEFIKMENNLIKTLETMGIKVLSIDLYNLVIEILQKDRGDWDWVMSSDRNKEELLEELKGILGVEDKVIPAVADKMAQNEGNYDVLFLTGCGNIFPYLRTHTILNNLHTHIKKPVIVFFPGVSVSKGSPYAAFNLFGRIDEGNDYRAANIFQIRGL